MTITTTLEEHLRIAHRYEAEDRWAQAAEAYGGALASLQHANSLSLIDDRLMLEQLRQSAVNRSHETTSLPSTAVTDEAAWALDRAGCLAAQQRDCAIRGVPWRPEDYP